MATAMVSSASSLLAMLNENHPILKLHALSNLNALVDYFWPEISTSVPTIYGMDTAKTRHRHGRDTDFTYRK